MKKIMMPYDNKFSILDKYYEYLAYTLILGNNSPVAKDLKIYYSLIPFSISDNFKVIEIQGLTVKGNRDTTRALKISSDVSIETSHVLANDVAQIVTLINKSKKISISDSIFSDVSFVGNRKIWEKELRSKIDLIKTVIDILIEGKFCDIPLIIADLPNITLILLNNPEMCEGVR